ncbi:MAG: T9SS type A sorting domain-containing protein [Chitinophagaceae bacterium]|nr:T9SS type A sorting domain-containing protein [Chitinophagaceae bacterium]
MARKIFLIIFLEIAFFQIAKAQITFSLPSNASPAAIDYAEYFIDTDPGFGNGITIPVTSSTDATINNYLVDLNSVNPGAHRIYFRTRDVNGVWSLTNEKTFFKLFPEATIPSSPVAGNITRVEYFFDTDPGPGNGTSIPFSSSNDITISNASLDITGLSAGVHHIYIRTQNTGGSWSLTNMQTFFIANVAAQIPPNPVATNIVKMEYFIDTDPGPGNGIPISITSSTDVSASDVGIDLSALSNGVHRIYFRTQDTNGSWSETNVQTFNILMANVVIPSNPIPGNITQLEYFFDTDPGFGKGTIINVPSGTDLSNYNFVADISGLKTDSTHTLYVRTLDDWSLTNTRTFVIGNLVPLTWISFNAKSLDRGVALDWTTAAEKNTDRFDVERSADGVHFHSIGRVKASGNSSSQNAYHFTDNQPENGVNFYRLKQWDIDGHFTYSIIISVKMKNGLNVTILGNPVQQTLRVLVEGNKEKPVHLRICSMAGKVLNSVISEEGTQSINVQDFAAGQYFLTYDINKQIFSIPFYKK